MAGWEESKVDSNSERGEELEGLEGSQERGMIKKWDTRGVQEWGSRKRGGGTKGEGQKEQEE